tara:strand:+ start:1 stop:1263 length:1263 start_codon:yes stop_codon:yes gene_type:complete
MLDEPAQEPIIYCFKNMAYAEYVTSLIQYAIYNISGGADEPDASGMYVIGFTIDKDFLNNVSYVKHYITDPIVDSNIIDLYISSSDIGRLLYVNFEKRFNEKEYITNIIYSFTYYSKYTYPEDNEWFFPELYIVFLYTFIFGYESRDDFTQHNLPIDKQCEQLREQLSHLQDVLQNVESEDFLPDVESEDVDPDMVSDASAPQEDTDVFETSMYVPPPAPTPAPPPAPTLAPTLEAYQSHPVPAYMLDRDYVPFNLQKHYSLDFDGSFVTQDRKGIKKNLTKICIQFILNATSMEYDDDEGGDESQDESQDAVIDTDKPPKIQFRIKRVLDILKPDVSTITAITDAEDASYINFSTLVAGGEVSVMSDTGGGGRKYHRNKSRKRRKQKKYSRKNTKKQQKHTQKRRKKHKNATKRKREIT